MFSKRRRRSRREIPWVFQKKPRGERNGDANESSSSEDAPPATSSGHGPIKVFVLTPGKELGFTYIEPSTTGGDIIFKMRDAIDFRPEELYLVVSQQVIPMIVHTCEQTYIDYIGR